MSWFRREPGTGLLVEADQSAGYVADLRDRIADQVPRDPVYGHPFPPGDVPSSPGGFACCLHCSVTPEPNRCDNCPRPKRSAASQPATASRNRRGLWRRLIDHLTKEMP